MMTVDAERGRGEFCGMLAGMGAKRGAEIGVWAGEFSEMLCRMVPGLHLTCVDPWMAYDDYREKKNDQPRLEAAYQATRARLKRMPHEILRMTSFQAAALVPDGSLDFVYIDGNHAEQFVRADLERWSPKVRQGGIVAGHDYELKPTHAHVEVKAAVDAFMRDHRIENGYVLTKDKAPSFYWVKP